MGLQSDGGPEQSAARPTLVTAVGWLAVVVAMLAVLFNGAFLAFILSIRGQLLQNIRSSLPDMEGELVPKEVGWLFYFVAPVAAAFSVALGCCGVTAGVYFLKLRAWGRALLEGTTWVALGYTVLIGLAIGVLAVGMLRRIPEEYGPPIVIRLLVIAGSPLSVLVTQGAPLIAVIWLLRSKTVREAMTK